MGGFLYLLDISFTTTYIRRSGSRRAGDLAL